MKNGFDVIVVGLGAAGSATLYQLAKQGRKVLGIDRFSPPHAHGSSHGDTRITRQAIGEGEQYTPLSLRSYELWREIEKEAGKNLLTVTGGLIISSAGKKAINHVAGFFDNTIAAAKKHGVAHRLLDTKQIRARFPQFQIADNETGYYEDNAGFLRPEECVSAQLALAEKYGAIICRNETLTDIQEGAGSVKITTSGGSYEAEQTVLSVGAWLPEFMKKEASLFAVRRQVLFWFDVKTDIKRFQPENFPVFIWELQGGKQGIYGFPAIDGKGGGVKIATEQYKTTTTPDSVDRNVSAEEIREMYANCVAPYFPDLSEKCVKTSVCLYTVTPDFGFVIDRHPQYSRVILVSPCSGHGFKHSAAIGEAVAELATHGKSKIDTSGFLLSRF